VAEETAVGDLGEIDGERPCQQHDGHRRNRGRSDAPFEIRCGRRARHPRAVRKLKSARSTPARFVTREVSCRISYKRSIFRTNTPISYRAPVCRALAPSEAASDGCSINV